MKQGLETFKVYVLAMEIGDSVWNIVGKWDWFSKSKFGLQFTDAADSIAANISEGYGRFFYKENRQFCFFARGSLSETRTWSEKAFNRSLMTDDEHSVLSEKITSCHKMLNSYIKYINEEMKKSKESPGFH